MRQGPNGRRPRGRPNRKQHGGPARPNSFDSSGPEGRIRGNAHQVYEKYVGLARDAISAGDRVAAEAYFQHAEHYFRIVNSSTDPVTAERRPARSDGNGRDADGREPAGDTAPARGTAPASGPSSETPQVTPAEPQQPVGDRDGLDRVLGRDKADSRPMPRTRAQPPAEGVTNAPADSDSVQAPVRRRPRQRPVRSQVAETAGDGAERPERKTGGSGNGAANPDAPAEDRVAAVAVETASGPQEGMDVAAPREKDQDTEPVGT